MEIPRNSGIKSLKMASVVFVQVAAPLAKLLLCGKPLKSPGNIDKSLEKSWEYAKDVLACFIDLEKAYDQVP